MRLLKENSTETNIGIHYGDLGKAEFSRNMFSSDRSTGHFGTGTYFFSSEQSPGAKYYAGDRPRKTVDFSKYDNLYKPENNEDAYKLNWLLKQINDINWDVDFLDVEEYGRSMAAHEKSEAYIKKYLYSENETWDWKEDDYKSALDEVIKLLKEEDEDEAQKLEWSLEEGKLAWDVYEREFEPYIRKNAKRIEEKGSETEDLIFQLYTLLGESKEEIKKALKTVAEAWDKMDRSYNAPRADSLSTVFMKSLGYGGIDVRHLTKDSNGSSGLDNASYGSVIYDVKPESILENLSNKNNCKILENIQNIVIKESDTSRQILTNLFNASSKILGLDKPKLDISHATTYSGKMTKQGDKETLELSQNALNYGGSSITREQLLWTLHVIAHEFAHEEVMAHNIDHDKLTEEYYKKLRQGLSVQMPDGEKLNNLLKESKLLEDIEDYNMGYCSVSIIESLRQNIPGIEIKDSFDGTIYQIMAETQGGDFLVVELTTRGDLVVVEFIELNIYSKGKGTGLKIVQSVLEAINPEQVVLSLEDASKGFWAHIKDRFNKFKWEIRDRNRVGTSRTGDSNLHKVAQDGVITTLEGTAKALKSSFNGNILKESSQYHTQKAIKHFGITTDPTKAGFILPDGRLLALGSGYSREDHRVISQIYTEEERDSFENNSALLQSFINDGNIRWSPEAPGIDISEDAEPTEAQLGAIKKLVREYGSEFFIDISRGRNGEVVESEQVESPFEAVLFIDKFFNKDEYEEEDNEDENEY